MLISTPEELAELVGRKESETLEFKESFGPKAIETAGAFSNTRGGIILIGITKERKVKGTSITTECLKEWANHISNASEPTLIPEISALEVEGRAVAVILLKEFPLKPVAIKGRCYRRVGPSNRKMTPAEISEMHMQSVGTTWDSIPSPGKAVDDLDLEKVRHYRDKAIKVGRRHFEKDEDLSTLLQKLELVKGDAPTWAAMIAFGKRPPMQAKVKCGKIRLTSTIVDDFVVDAPLLKQVDEVMNYMRRVYQLSYEFSGQPERTEVWEYPLEAVREAVTNAICHRDYSHPAEIQIKIFDDYMVIWNPGQLPLGMTVEKLMDPAHRSIPRNTLVAMLFYDIELIERYGSGIKRILDDCKRLGFPEPEFTETEGGLEVRFRKNIYTEEYLKGMGLNDRQIKAILYVNERKAITNSEYQELNQTTKKTATRDLTDLVERNVLRKIGTTGKGTQYELTGHKGDIKGTRELSG